MFVNRKYGYFYSVNDDDRKLQFQGITRGDFREQGMFAIIKTLYVLFLVNNFHFQTRHKKSKEKKLYFTKEYPVQFSSKALILQFYKHLNQRNTKNIQN